MTVFAENGQSIIDRLVWADEKREFVRLKCYPNINPGQRNLLANWAQKYSLLGSQGSDFHSPEKAWAQLGRFPPMPDDIDPVWRLWAA